ncbi:peptidoglycan-binding protein [Novisyntrophococcus fermenticellae]|uniref:peptidoglycan-binding protein n=1 Tax=Novisyntrophococcus fermenticellae TaxID=2068655 RepID=UPI001E458717|nr:peptidoglycan-binding protein [Novisyntrophococcus fermenticellae]
MKKMDENQVDTGELQIQVNARPQNRPISQAKISISYTGNPNQILEELTTDSNGRTPTIDLPAPPVEYSMEPAMQQPYSEYTLNITAEGYEPIEISGSQLLPGEIAIQPVLMNQLTAENQFLDIAISAHTLYYEFPPKIPEAEIKPVNETGEIVLSRVVIPEYVIVHDGSPEDPTAANYYERYRDYIKNVASSEIYATWPDSAIRANVLAIMSFTLNRVYTEWYRNKGHDFTITSSTAYDHKWTRGRNYFDNISLIVDEIFSYYLSRPNVRQPILTQYCDGHRVTCPNWMSQWGSKSLGDQGYTPIQILRNYYGQDMYINSAEEISGVPASWPGYNLDIGATGPKVTQIQEQLNAIANVYSAIPPTTEDGILGEGTKRSVTAFQSLFNLPATGIIDYPTWYKIQDIYVAVTRIAELNP